MDETFAHLPLFTPSEFVAVTNQIFEHAMQVVLVQGEVSSFRVSKDKWVYFDIKDDNAKLRCFGIVWQLKTQIADGMQVEIMANPKLHAQFGLSLNIVSIRPVGVGSIRKAAALLQEKLEKEGLFAPERKRHIPSPPDHIALVASGDSAAYADFVKIMQARWPLLHIDHYDVQVQGDVASEQIVHAIDRVNQSAVCYDAIVITRGGGSIDDLNAFSTEPVTRAVAGSRIPTVVAIGHETDVSLAERAADLHASTPSNAAELLVPDWRVVVERLSEDWMQLYRDTERTITDQHTLLKQTTERITTGIGRYIEQAARDMQHTEVRLNSYHPDQILKQGYAIVRQDGVLLKGSGIKLDPQKPLSIELETVMIEASVEEIKEK